MAFKLRIGNLYIIETSKDSPTSPESEIEKGIRSLEDKVESQLKNWVRNDRFFDFLRSTGARVVLFVLTWTILYGFGYLAFTNSYLTWWYVFSLAVVLSIHAISVRYVFGSLDGNKNFDFRILSYEADDLVDEYQRARRDKAFRIAYRNVAGWAGFLIALYLTLSIMNASNLAGEFEIPSSFIFDFSLSLEQMVVLLAAVIGFFSVQKYIGWGLRGEPKRAKEETNN